MAGRLNLTSQAALARILESINECYKTTLASVGLVYSKRTTAVAKSVIGSQYLTFSNIIKILSVFDATVNPPRILGEFSFDELRNNPTQSGILPNGYAIATVGPQSVTIFIDSQASAVFSLTADAISVAGELQLLDVPSFTENFHDVLVYGAMEIEYDKLEKTDKAAQFHQKYQGRLGELQYFLSVSAYRDIYPGKSNPWAPRTPSVNSTTP